MRIGAMILSGILTWATISHAAGEFGKPIQSGNVISLTEAVEAKESNEGKLLLVSGEVRKVCLKKGCWLMLTDHKTSVRVVFTDYSYFVPQELKGKKVHAAGHLVKKTLSEKMVKHFMEDEGRSKQEIDAVSGAQEVLQFVADGVRVIESST